MRQRDIFLFWLPLFASWLLMTAEGPIVSAAINRLPNEVIMLAAQGIVIGGQSPAIRMVLHRDVDDAALDRAIAAFRAHYGG